MPFAPGDFRAKRYGYRTDDRFEAAVFVSTYNQPMHLELVLAGLETQIEKSFEVIICDDGSTTETSTLIETFGRQTWLRITHVWQPNHGFRKCRILNEGVRQSSAPYCIFLDGDCIPHPLFIEDHLKSREAGCYLAGRRVDLGPGFSGNLKPEIIKKHGLHLFQMNYLWSGLTRDSRKIRRAVHISPEWLRRIFGYAKVTDLKGCNYSVSRDNLLKINGFDEAYEGYGREDTDVEIRMQNAGLKIKSVKGIAIQFHVWHPERAFVSGNDERLAKAMMEKRVRAVRGIIHDSSENTGRSDD